MMISPEGYYEEHLKGKTAAQIMTAIRGLKNEMGHLKNIMEHPDYGEQPIMHPSESTRLWCTRLYLERAKEALAEAGGTYVPSQAELKAADFEDNMPYMKGYRGSFDVVEFEQPVEIAEDNKLPLDKKYEEFFWYGVISSWLFPYKKGKMLSRQ